jgi:membrane peptidoglycan carboxypeptidase
MAEGLLFMSEVVEKTDKMVATMRKAALYPLGLLSMFGLLLALFAINAVPVLAELMPPDKWPASGQTLYAVSTLMADHGLTMAAAFLGLVGLFMFSLSRWTGPVRTVADRYLPYSLYRDYAGSMLLISLSSMMRAGVSLRSALERSLNLVTVRIAQQVTMARVSDVANRFGVINNMPPYLAMSLGAGETTVVRMAAAYASFVNGGRRVEPSLIDSVQDQRGRVIWRGDQRACQGCDGGPDSAPPTLSENRRQIADPIATYQIVNILQGAVQRGTGGRAGQGLNRPVAGKTGTTDDYKDNWFVGFTPDLVVAVWFGFDEPRSLGNNETGGLNAAPIFRDVMEAALRGSPPVPFRAPPGVSLVRVTLDNGQSLMEAFRPGTENAAQPVDGTATGAGAASRVESGLGGLY